MPPPSSKRLYVYRNKNKKNATHKSYKANHKKCQEIHTNP